MWLAVKVGSTRYDLLKPKNLVDEEAGGQTESGGGLFLVQHGLG